MKNKFKLIKYTLAGAVVAGYSLAMPFSTFAQGSDNTLINSGDYANVQTQNTQNTSVSVSNQNTLNSTQSMNVNADSGHNELNGNIGGSSLTTGNAVVQGTFNTTANSNTTGIGGMMQGATAGMGQLGQGSNVVNTGDHTSVNNTMTDTKSVTVTNSNNASVQQALNATTNSGHNHLNGNISGMGMGGGSTQLTTGGAAVGANFQVTANENKAYVDMGNGSNMMGNQSSLTNTGDYANVTNTANSTSNTTVSNSNTANVGQTLHGTTNSGYNQSNGGIGGSGMMTGGASLFGTFGVMANRNTTGVGQTTDFGGLLNLGDVVNTGDHLNAQNSVNSQHTVTAASANYLTDNKAVSFTSNSGQNTMNGGIGSGGMNMTGAAQFGQQMNTSANQNSSVFGNGLDVLAFLLGS